MADPPILPAVPGATMLSHGHASTSSETQHRSYLHSDRPSKSGSASPDRHYLPAGSSNTFGPPRSSGTSSSSSDRHPSYSGHSISHPDPTFRGHSNSSGSSSSNPTSSMFTSHPDSNSRGGSSSQTTAPPSPTLHTHRHWAPTTHVPRHIADRHRGGQGGGNRWLSDDEGGEIMAGPSRSGSGAPRSLGRRRRGSDVVAGGSGAGPSTSAGPSHTSSAHRLDDGPKPQYQFQPDLPNLPKLNTHPPLRRPTSSDGHRPRLHHRPRSSPPKVARSSLSVSSRDGSNSPRGGSADRGEPPTIADLVPPPNHGSGMRVLRTQMALIDPPGPSGSGGSVVEADGEDRSTEGGLERESMEGLEPSSEASGEGMRRDRSAAGSEGERTAGSGTGTGTSRSGSGEPDTGRARESERKKVWRAGLLGQLKKLLTCTLCPPGTDQLLHHPLTLPCGHTLSSEHLSLPAPAPLPENFSTLPSHDQHLLQQQQQHSRLSLWAGIMCPIPTCKRYSSHAIPSDVTHEPLSPVAAFMAPPLASLAPTAPAPISLASGVMYYPPPPPPAPAPSPTSHQHHPPPAYSPDPPINETGSPLLDTAVDKVMFLVMRELGLGQFSSRVSAGIKGLGHVHNEAEHVAAAVYDRDQAMEAEVPEEAAGRHAHFDAPSGGPGPGTLTSGISMDLSSASLAEIPSQPSTPSSSHTHRPKPTPAQTDRTTSDTSVNTATTGSAGSLNRKISKRRKNTQGEPGRPELSFEKELMGILECDVCALLLYEPVTTPCQHSFCGKCLSRSLDHSHRCPVCRQDLPGYAYFQDHAVNKVLLTIIKTAFPAEYLDRQESIEKDERDARLDTAIFICTLAFPGMPTILHVFEPRYRLMIRRCIESASPRFGMLMPGRGRDGVGEYGTMLEIQSVQMLPDGRSMVETVGTQRFRLLEAGSLDGYTVGRIERIDDISPEEEAALEAEAIKEAALAAASAPPPSTPSPSISTNPSAFQSLLPPQSDGPAPIPGLPGQPPILSSDAPTPVSTADLMAVCHSFIDQLRSGSAPWLLQRLNSTYGTMPTDPAEFSYWMALVMPIDENEKARLLPIRSPRLRLKLIVHWVESLRGSWWFSSGCVVG